MPAGCSVIGLDNIISAEFHVPSLTTIRQPLNMMGRLAAKILVDRIANPDKHYAPSILVKPKLTARESSAQVKKSL